MCNSSEQHRVFRTTLNSIGSLASWWAVIREAPRNDVQKHTCRTGRRTRGSAFRQCRVALPPTIPERAPPMLKQAMMAAALPRRSQGHSCNARRLSGLRMREAVQLQPHGEIAESKPRRSTKDSFGTEAQRDFL